jgi:tetratricopeptide (TPR) repeat protein
MFNLIISLLLCTGTLAGLHLLAGVELWISSLVAMAVFTVVFIVITRIVMKKVGRLMETAQHDLQAGRTEKAIKTLESGYRYSKWQFYVKGQIDAQIGTLLFMKRDFSKAFDYLKKAFVRHWIAMGMLGVCYMKRNQVGKMIETFDKAVSATKKEALLWNLYAYCLEKVGEKDKAVSVMEKGLKKTGGDERLEANLRLSRRGAR